MEQTLIIDAGTCITYTLVKEGKLIGGAISPGMRMRYNALHHFTGRLPQLTIPQDETPVIGSTTEESLHSGVVHGIVAEIKGMITNFCSENNEFNVIITGGDGGYLGSRLKTTIFALPHLTIEGLNSIYAFNYREKIS
jgi:type III pantothenate kinase